MLPPGGLVPEDYAFDTRRRPTVAPAKVRMSELFAPGRDTLMLYSFMFPRHPEDERPKADARRDREAPARREPVPVVHGPARPARRRGPSTSRRS